MSISQKHICKKARKDIMFVEIPVEAASLTKRLSSPGYLLLHPDKTQKAVIYNFISGILHMFISMIIIPWLLTEIIDFIYLVLNYGFLR